MTTLIVPPAPGRTQPSAERFASVTANLLPEEITLRRAAHKARRTALICVGAAVVLMAAVTGGARLRTASANSDLSDAQHQAQVLTNQQSKYSSLVQAKERTQAIQQQLATLMANDLNWSKYYDSITAAAPHGVSITSLGGELNPSTGAAAGVSATPQLNSSGEPTVGTLNISGTAASKNQVAAFVDALGSVKGVSDPYPSSITTGGSGASAVIFNLTCLITAPALGGRFALPTTPSAVASTGGTK